MSKTSSKSSVGKVFGIIRYHNSPIKATLPDGTDVYRQDKIFVSEYGGDIPCAPYSDNFIYAMPKKFIKVPSFACTCGAPAVITGASGYVMDASPQGKMFVCLTHATIGHHANNSKNRWA
jgi:hypothetical protein